MELNEYAMGEQDKREMNWNQIVKAFDGLEGMPEHRAVNHSSEMKLERLDTLSYSDTYFHLSVIYALLYEGGDKGRVVCSIAHPFRSDQRVHVLSFALYGSGLTNFQHNGKILGLTRNAFEIRAMVAEAAIRASIREADAFANL